MGRRFFFAALVVVLVVLVGCVRQTAPVATGGRAGWSAEEQAAYAKLSPDAKALADSGRLVFQDGKYIQTPALLPYPGGSGGIAPEYLKSWNCPLESATYNSTQNYYLTSDGKPADAGTYYGAGIGSPAKPNNKHPAINGLQATFLLPTPLNSIIMPPLPNEYDQPSFNEAPYAMFSGWSTDETGHTVPFDAGFAWQDNSSTAHPDAVGWYLFLSMKNANAPAGDPKNPDFYMMSQWRLRASTSTQSVVRPQLAVAPRPPFEVTLEVRFIALNEISLTAIAGPESEWYNWQTDATKTELTHTYRLLMGNPLQATSQPYYPADGADVTWSIQFNFARSKYPPLKGATADPVGAVKLGHVAIDGSKLQANASKSKAMSYARMELEEQRLLQEIREYFDACDEVDAAEDEAYGDDDGNDVPPHLRKREDRLAAIEQAKKELEREAIERAEEEQAARRENAEAEGREFRARKDPKDAKPSPQAQRNFTDHESRIMLSGKAVVQGYNTQIAVDGEHQVIVATDLTNQAADAPHLPGLMNQMHANTGAYPAEVSADAGYYSEENLDAIEGTGATALVAPGRITHNEWRDQKAPRGRIPNGLTRRQRMKRFLSTKAGKAKYKLRQVTAEPVYGQIKHARGLRQVLHRGLARCGPCGASMRGS